MDYGILERDNCFKSVITSNNVNKYTIRDVESLGKESVSGNNVGFAEYAHNGKGIKFLQTFQTELTDDFIRQEL